MGHKFTYIFGIIGIIGIISLSWIPGIPDMGLRKNGNTELRDEIEEVEELAKSANE